MAKIVLAVMLVFFLVNPVRSEESTTYETPSPGQEVNPSLAKLKGVFLKVRREGREGITKEASEGVPSQILEKLQDAHLPVEDSVEHAVAKLDVKIHSNATLGDVGNMSVKVELQQLLDKPGNPGSKEWVVTWMREWRGVGRTEVPRKYILRYIDDLIGHWQYVTQDEKP